MALVWLAAGGVVVGLGVVVAGLARLCNPRHSIPHVKHSTRPEPDPEVFPCKLQSVVRGIWLHTCKWVPDNGKPIKGVVVLVHGFGEHSGRYDHVAARLNAQGFAVTAFDHQGHGRSEGERNYWERFEHLTADLGRFLEHQHPWFDPALPRFVLAHSLGALIATSLLATLSDEQRRSAAFRFRGVVLTGPAFDINARLHDPAVKLLRVLSDWLPKLPLSPRMDFHDLCSLPTCAQAYYADPLVSRRWSRARSMHESVRGVESVQGFRFQVPLLVCHGGKDNVCLLAGVSSMLDRAQTPDKTLNLYPGAYHELFHDVQWSKVADEVVAWLNSRVEPVERSVFQPTK